MKNLIKVIICAAIVLMTINSNQAQSNVGAVNESRLVIATSGLNLRKAPTLKSSVIKLVKYGHEVQVIENPTSIKQDTIEIGNGKELVGQWLKVSYRGDKGYMFSPFLAKIEAQYFPTELVDENFALLFEGSNCYYNFQYRRGFSWTGIYKTVSGKYRSKKVNVTYSTSNEMGHESYSIDTDEQEDLLFIVGSKTTEINVNDGNYSYFESIRDQKGKILDRIEYNDFEGTLTYCHDDMSYNLSDEKYQALSIVWRGDLDDDGFDDFIIQYGENDGRIVLHLSSQAEAGDLFKAVAEYYIGYCC